MRQGVSQPRQPLEGVRDPDSFAGSADVEPHTPAQPGGAGAKARVPAGTVVEFADEIEQARRRGVEVSRQLSDFVTELID
jgi:hypothetical protein